MKIPPKKGVSTQFRTALQFKTLQVPNYSYHPILTCTPRKATTRRFPNK